MKRIKDIVLIALLTTILIVQEYLLGFLPNVQLTFFLIVLFSKCLGLIKTSIICIIYILLDGFLSGGMGLIFMPFMLIGLLIIPLSLNTIFKKIDSSFCLALLGILFAFIYSFINIIPGCIMFDMSFYEYLLGDITWEIILAINNFISIFILYKPCRKMFNNVLKKEGF